MALPVLFVGGVYDTTGVQLLTLWCVCAGGLAMASELMAITGLTARALVHLARSAFGTVLACLSAASAASLGIFLSDGVTGDGMGLCLIRRSSLSVLSCNEGRGGRFILLCVWQWCNWRRTTPLVCNF